MKGSTRVPLCRLRACIAAAAAITTALLLNVAPASAAAAPATISGPIGGAPVAVATTAFDLADVGYQQSEFFMSGTASSYEPTAPLTTDGHWTVTPAATAPYTTRLIVYRPSDPSRFNGTVYVEWLNVSTGADFAADWLFAHTEVLRQGAVYVLVSAQRAGVNTAKAASPTRYGPLSHPGDSFSYDIFSQAGQAIKDSASTLLGGLTPERLLGIGESQSANRFTTYVNAVQPVADVYDGFLPHSRIGAAAPLSQSPQADVPAPEGTRMRDDQVPVLDFQSETDAAGNAPNTLQQPDSDLYRVWNVTGAAHADSYLLDISFTDVGDRYDTAKKVFDSLLHPSAVTLLGTCAKPINAGPNHYVLEAALAGLNSWVTSGTPPASAPRFQFASFSPVTFAFDSNGNVLGGIRTPFVDAPIAQLSGLTAGGAGFCVLFGSTTPFTQDQLDALYRNHGKFVTAWNRSTKEAVRNGFIVAANEAALKRVAAHSAIGK
jgi:hypothetical protein